MIGQTVHLPDHIGSFESLSLLAGLPLELSIRSLEIRMAIKPWNPLLVTISLCGTCPFFHREQLRQRRRRPWELCVRCFTYSSGELCVLCFTYSCVRCFTYSSGKSCVHCFTCSSGFIPELCYSIFSKSSLGRKGFLWLLLQGLNQICSEVRAET